MSKQPTTTKQPATKSVRFKYVKSTKNCHRYEEIDAAGNVIDQRGGAPFSVGTLYVRKSLVGEQPTEFLSITVTTEGGLAQAA